MGGDDLLSSIAFSCSSTSSSSLSSSHLGWDSINGHNFNSFGVFKPDMITSQCMGGGDGVLPRWDVEHDEDTCLESDTSTGYLEDVFLSEFNSKRRRFLMYSSSHHQTTSQLHHPSIRKWWPSSSSSQCSDHEDRITDADADERRDKKRGRPTKVVYPFDVVKPLGLEGGATLNDINERILMPPTRPVRHPVGDYACHPMVSPEGPGLSGKAVVAYTRIHTQGRGTITIVRTRG